MKMMKGLLLGSAAGLVAVASAQAADLPVKAKPVEYVKVCSTYGAGFFYVPGTDTCLKLGMYLRSEISYGVGPGSYFFAGPTAQQTRTSTNEFSYRARINLTTDWRTNSDYGVIRAYANIIAQQSQGGAALNDIASSQGSAGILRAFIQFAGFTVGHAVSYFDFFNGADYGYMPSIWIGSTGVNGTHLIAYTFQLGNGFSASVDIEDGGGVGSTAPGGAPGGNGRPRVVIDANSTNGLTLGGATINNKGGNAPDFAGNIRVDQAWGSAQIMAAAHDASGGYYTSPFAINAPATGILTTNGHPGDVWGWAIGGGFKLLNFLMPKDVLEFQADYSKGAINYVGNIYQNIAFYGGGNQLGLGWAVDNVFTNQGGNNLTEAWGFAAAYQHFWNAQWRTAVVGGYTEYNYSGAAAAAICGAASGVAATPFSSGALGIGGAGAALISVSNCSPSFSLASVSTRTAWNPHPTLEIGLDLEYAHINTGFAGLATLPAAGARPAGLYTVKDQDYYGTVLRFQKTILP